jgi:hypothetical protein
MKTCTTKAWDSIKSAIDKQYVMGKAHEIRTGSGETVPKDAIHLFTDLMPYGDMNYYVCPDGSYVCEYFDIGD